MMSSPDKRDFISLNTLLDGIVALTQEFHIQINRLVMDSRIVQAGDLFIALPGLTSDGRDYIDDAIERGARAILWQCEQGAVPIPVSWRPSSSGNRVPVIAIEDLTNKVGVLADRFYHSPSKSLYAIGITGTNGKTSCSHFIAQAVEPYSHCGVIGTMGWGFTHALQASTHTTPDAITCHYWLRNMLDAGAKSVAMEVSSHALDQGRVAGIHFDCAVFTNLSHDHLDYHGDMESYGNAKRKLFQLDSIQHLVINVDDPFGQELASQNSANKNLLRYGLDRYNSPDISATDIEADESGTRFTLLTRDSRSEVHTHIYGLFNVYNLLATAGVMLSMDMSLEQIVHRLSSLDGIEGRLEVIGETGKPVFVIDYAHTPDALEQAIEAIQQHFKGNIWCVVGCGGDRDRQKRPAMGAIAERYADRVVITSDNPRTESPQVIADNMLAGMEKPDSAVVELDRKLAIQYAFENANDTDVILVAGKGHEDYQIIGNQKYPFSDKAIIKTLLQEGSDE